MKLIPTLLCDFYKISHRQQYPQGTEVVYSTWTPRSGKHANGITEVVAFGFQGVLKEITEVFDSGFFNKTKAEVITEYSRVIKNCLFVPNPDTSHIEELHDLGYLPIKVKALEEGTLVPFRVPMLTIENTNNRFFWVTNFLETALSSNLWKPSTTATIARQYKHILNRYAGETTGSITGVEFQGHDFSMRGQSGVEDSARSGVGHLLSFVGTDTIPAIMYAEEFYNADIEKELIGCSVPASEHSVMCASGKNDELETYRRLIEDVHPTGIVSIVSDTWDLWYVITNILPKLKDKILARNGGEGSIDKVVIRPDSGNPADILCGDANNSDSNARKGVIELLWDIFGGTVNDQGYKVLNSHIGAIYGDSITPIICEDICERLKDKGFASTNVVFGIGSYTYQFITRDTLGFAMKATSVTINGVETPIFKDPKTDDGTKKSAKGRVGVYRDNNGELVVLDSESKDRNVGSADLLELIYENGEFVKETSLSEIRARLK